MNEFDHRLRPEHSKRRAALVGAAVVIAVFSAALLLAQLLPERNRVIGRRPAGTSAGTGSAPQAVPYAGQATTTPVARAEGSPTIGAQASVAAGGTPGLVASPAAAATPQAWPCPPTEAEALGDCTLDQLAARLPDLAAARREGHFQPLDLRQTQDAYTLVLYGAYVHVEAGARWIVVVYTASGPGDGGRTMVMPALLADEQGTEIRARTSTAILTSKHATAGAIYFDAPARQDTAPILRLQLTLTLAQGAPDRGAQPAPIAPPFSFAFSIPDPPAGTP